MTDLDDVMERLLGDAEYRRSFTADPAAALAGYSLTDSERQMLLTRISPDTMLGSAVEQRTSKAGMFALIGEAAQLFDAPGGGGEAFTIQISPAESPDPGEPNGIIINDRSADVSGFIIYGSPSEEGPTDLSAIHGFDPQPDPPGHPVEVSAQAGEELAPVAVAGEKVVPVAEAATQVRFTR